MPCIHHECIAPLETPNFLARSDFVIPKALVTRFTIFLFSMLMINLFACNVFGKDRKSILESQEKIDCASIHFLYYDGMSENEINISEFIKAAREKLGLTQLQLAEFIGCTKGNISAWEKGRHEPSYSQMVKLSKKSGIPLPHDQANEFIDILGGLKADELDVDQIAIIQSAAKVPKENRQQVRKIVRTFTETNNDDKEVNGE